MGMTTSSADAPLDEGGRARGARGSTQAGTAGDTADEFWGLVDAGLVGMPWDAVGSDEHDDGSGAEEGIDDAPAPAWVLDAADERLRGELLAAAGGEVDAASGAGSAGGSTGGTEVPGALA